MNETGLQPLSRPVEQILVFVQKVLKRDHAQKVLKLCNNSLRFRGNFSGKLNGCFLGKTSLSKNFQMKSGVGDGTKTTI